MWFGARFLVIRGSCAGLDWESSNFAVVEVPLQVKKLFLAWLAAAGTDLVVGLLAAPLYRPFQPPLQAQGAMVLAIQLLFLAVFVLLFDRAHAGFGGGVKGGALCGFLFGVLHALPNLQLPPLLMEFPWGLAWLWTGNMIVSNTLAGAAMGAIYGRNPARHAVEMKQP